MQNNIWPCFCSCCENWSQWLQWDKNKVENKALSQRDKNFCSLAIYKQGKRKEWLKSALDTIYSHWQGRAYSSLSMTHPTKESKYLRLEGPLLSWRLVPSEFRHVLHILAKWQFRLLNVKYLQGLRSVSTDRELFFFIGWFPCVEPQPL